MKRINKNLANEPKELIEHRSTPNSKYESMGEVLQMPLCADQGNICAYCMRRIAPNGKKMTVEHYHSQKNYLHLDRIYSNMLATCRKPFRDCSELKGDGELFVDPQSSICETLFVYNNRGEIKAAKTPNEEKVTADIKLLDLNQDTLRENRAAIITKLGVDLAKDASSTNIRKLLKDWETLHSFGYREYCMVVVYYLNKKLRAKI